MAKTTERTFSREKIKSRDLLSINNSFGFELCFQCLRYLVKLKTKVDLLTVKEEGKKIVQNFVSRA